VKAFGERIDQADGLAQRQPVLRIGGALHLMVEVDE